MGGKHSKHHKAVQDKHPKIDPKVLLKNIDDDDTEAVKQKIEELFKTLDADGSGVLEGAEYDTLMKEFGIYVTREFDQKLFYSDEEYNVEDVKQWIKDAMDPDGDGRVTKEEMLNGTKQVTEWVET